MKKKSVIKSVLLRYFLLFLLGGYAYCVIEICARGYSHISMFVAGGICFILIGGINKIRGDFSLIGQMFISALIITSIEFITGCIVNKWLGLDVWDYSKYPYNYKGQICLLYSNIWFCLSLLGIVLDDFIRYWLMGDDKPQYKIF